MLAPVVGNRLPQPLNFLLGLSYLCVVQKTFALAQGGKLCILEPVHFGYRPHVLVGEFLFYTATARCWLHKSSVCKPASTTSKRM